jgi:hypothetical protein
MQRGLALGLASLLLPSSLAVAEPKSVSDKATKSETSARCELRGSARPPTNATIAGPDGRTIARFSGSELELSVLELSRTPPLRARIETGTGRGSFRVHGFIDASLLPVFGARDLAVVPGHLFLSAHRRLTIVGAEPDRVKVERKLSPPFEQTLSTWVACSALELAEKTPPGFTPAGDARGYALRRASLELFALGPGERRVVSLLHKAPEADAVLFFSTETRDGFVHVAHRSDVVVDAWARSSDLEALPRGETLDQLAGSTMRRSRPRLAVEGEPRSVRATREVPLRNAASDRAAVIGVIEPDADTYVLDVTAGWASVMPKSLAVFPAENAQFWVKASELGI